MLDENKRNVTVNLWLNIEMYHVILNCAGQINFRMEMISNMRYIVCLIENNEGEN